VYYNRSEWKQAAGYVERALELREKLGDVVGYARSINNLGILKQASGDWDGALADYQRAVETHEQIGEVEGLAQAYTNLGVLCTDLGDWAQAEDYLRNSFNIAQRIGHASELAQAHMNLGRLYLLQARWADCARHLNASIPLYAEVGARANVNLIDAYDLQGRLALEQGQFDSAQQWATRCRELLREFTNSDSGDSVEWGRYEQLIGRIAMSTGDLAKARQHFDRSAAIFKATGSELEYGRAMYWSVALSGQLHDSQRASEEAGAARAIFSGLGAKADLVRIEKLNL
jgi:tetratricopeptide (TPR) repeat protein